MPIIGVGSKVIVITSSVKKGIGPKRGSIGYIAGIPSDVVYAGKTHIFAQPVRIIFTRYGFESKTRKERKPFINILPITRENTIHCYMKKTENVDNSLWAKMKTTLAGPAGRDKIAHGILVPLETDLMDCSLEEFSIWLESIISKGFIVAMNSMMLNRKKLAGIVDTKIMDMLLRIVDDKALRGMWIKSCQEDAVLRKLLIKTIRQITSINLRNSLYFDKTEVFKHLIKDSVSIGGVLIGNYYVDSEYYWKRNLIIDRINRNGLAYIEHLTKTRKELKCLARTYEEGHM